MGVYVNLDSFITSSRYSAVAEIITDSIEPMLEELGISQDFMGVTFIAVIPELAEFVNSIQFARNGDMGTLLFGNCSISEDICLEISGQSAAQTMQIEVRLFLFVY